MILQPITKISTLEELLHNKNNINVVSENQIPFKSLLENAINNVKETDSNLKIEVQKLATGETDDLHNVNIASTKAALALDMVVQLRNKALDSYNEIMRMGV